MAVAMSNARSPAAAIISTSSQLEPPRSVATGVLKQHLPTSTAEDVAVDEVEALILLNEGKHVLLLADNRREADVLEHIGSQHLHSGAHQWDKQSQGKTGSLSGRQALVQNRAGQPCQPKHPPRELGLRRS